MSTEQLLKDSLAFNMPVNNSKFSSLFRDGNMHFQDEQLKQNFRMTGGSFPQDNCLLQVNSQPASNGSLFSNLNHLNNIRSNLAHFNGLVNQSVNLYGTAGIVGCPTMNPYFLESMEHLHHLAASQKSPLSSRLIHVPNHSENFMEINSHPRRKNATRETTSILKAWLNEHKKNPYPTKGEKIMLAVITKMTLTQVSTWFANARRRLKKENKMTWSPNHKSDDEADDLEDTDSSDIPSRLQEDPSILTKSYSKELQNEFLSKLTGLNNISNDTKEPKLSSKPKIWSIADITSETEGQIQDNTKSNITSSQDDASFFQSSNTNNTSNSNPALQFLLWKHREIYQSPSSSLFIKSPRLPFDFNNFKNRMSSDSHQLIQNMNEITK